MIPRTDTCVTTTHVPYPILTNTHYMGASVHEPRVPYPAATHATPLPSRRGRRSTIPPEIREQTRRLKKQNMERRRRACISDKMNALHNLALSLVGVDPQESPKVEKADILGICYSVFEGIAKIAKEDPELKFRLHKLRNCLREPSTSSTNQSSMLHLIDETTRSSTVSEDSCSRSNSPFHSVQAAAATATSQHSIDYNNNKENHIPFGFPTTVHMSKVSPQLVNNRLPQSLADRWHSTPVNPTQLSSRQSSDSGFYSTQDGAGSMSHLMQSSPSSYPSSLTSSQSSQFPRPSQDHVFPKPCSSKYQIGSQTRSAFTPIRQTKTSPIPLLMSPSPNPPRSSLPIQNCTTSSKTTMWRPYLD